MNLSEVPIACTLTPDERPARRAMLHKVGQAVQKVEEREDGFAYRFASDAVLPELAEIVQLERQCCAFLRFTITAEPGAGPLWLEVTGPAGTKEFLRSFLLPES
jgi:hypothetical protein